MGRIYIGERALRLGVWIVVGLAVLALGFGISAFMIMTAPKADKAEPEVIVPAVNVNIVELTDHQVLLNSQGEVMALRRTQVAAEVGGKVIEVSPKFESGEVFGEGDVLLRIDPADYRAAHASAVATLENAKLSLEIEIANGKRAARDWEKLGRGEASDLVLRKPQLASARAAVSSAEAAVEKALLDLERTEVRTPYACRIERTHVDLGATVAPGSPLADVMSLGEVEMRLPLSLEDYGFVMRDDDGLVVGEVVATASVGGEATTWSGKLVRSDEFVERTTRTVNLVAEFDGEGDAAPKVGLFADAVVSGRTLPGVVVLPRLAMVGPDRVLVVDDENKIEFRKVDVVRTTRDKVVIKAVDKVEDDRGLEAGERVCITPLSAPVNGMSVKVKEAPEKEGDL